MICCRVSVITGIGTVLLVCISGLLISPDAEVAEGDGADDGGAVERREMVKVVVVDI